MATKLEEILAHTRSHVLERKATTDRYSMDRRASAHTPRGFAASLRAASKTRPAIIAELKKTSPSKGVLREDFRPVQLGETFQAAGAAALSVLTEERFFHGSIDHLQAVSRAVSIPLLRKDFIVDPFQVVEARAAGADAILLIVAAHNDRRMQELAAEASRNDLDVLCEAHTRDEVDRATQLGFTVIGINSRDLKTLTIDPEVQAELASLLPAGVLGVAESGVRAREDILRLTSAGYGAFLIGEALMREPHPELHLAALLGMSVPLTA